MAIKLAARLATGTMYPGAFESIYHNSGSTPLIINEISVSNVDVVEHTLGFLYTTSDVSENPAFGYSQEYLMVLKTIPANTILVNHDEIYLPPGYDLSAASVGGETLLISANLIGVETMAEKIVARSGSYSANTVTTLLENSGSSALVTHEISVHNPTGSDDIVQIYTTTSGGVIQEWLMNGTVGAGKILVNTDKIWLPVGYSLKFKTTAATGIIISANLYG